MQNNTNLHLLYVCFFPAINTKMKLVFLLLVGIGLAAGQVPGFGGCPEFDSQPDFDMNKVNKIPKYFLIHRIVILE